MTADCGEGHGVAEWAAGAKIGPQLGRRQRIRSYRWMLSICWMLSILSLLLLAIAVLEGGFAPAVHAASRRSTMYRSPLGNPLTKQQSASVINEGTDRHIKTISVSDILDDPTNNEESAEVYPALQRIGRQEGFTIKVVEASPTVWIRDDFLALSNGILLAPSSDPHVEDALKDLEGYAKLSLKKYRPIAARNEDGKVFNGLL